MEDITIYGKIIDEYETECPICIVGRMHVREVEYELPHVGKALIISKKCTRCGYKKNDIIPLNIKKHQRIYIRIEKTQDLYTKILRSPTATIYIPELGLELRPGIDAEMFITNIEGILHLFIDALKRIEILAQTDTSQAQEKIAQALDSGTSYTVIIDDPQGTSTVLDRPNSATQITIEYVE